MRYALHIVLVLLLVSAGCIGNGNPPASSSVTTTTHNTPDTDSDTVTTTKHTPSSDPVTPANLTSSGACDDDLWIGFWELNNEDVWDPDVVRVGYYTPPNSSFLLVAYVDGNVAGVNQIENQYVNGEHVDGDKIMLDSPLSGKHWVQVVAFSDENMNGQFDKEVDKACLVDGELVHTDSNLIDFSRL